jgi:hypothetical protein
MKHCPSCGTEYEDFARECMDCHTALEQGPPSVSVADTRGTPDAYLVVVHWFGGVAAALHAAQARSRLESQGISCFVSGEYSARLSPLTELGCSLLVREEDADEAKRILRDYLESNVKPQEDEPS